MTFPIEIHFRDMDPSESIERQVQQWAAKLHGADHDVERCEVVLSQPHRHHARGRRFHVRISLAVPGHEIVISGDPGEDAAHDDAHVAIRDAFLAARRRLDAHRSVP
jgi:hypothetical protein